MLERNVEGVASDDSDCVRLIGVVVFAPFANQ